MKATIVYKSWTDTHGTESKQYQYCALYAQHKNIEIKNVYEITAENRDELIRKLAYEMSEPQTEPHILIIYLSCDIIIPRQMSIFLPLVRTGLLEIHEAWAWRCFNENSDYADTQYALSCHRCKSCCWKRKAPKQHLNLKRAVKAEE